MPPKASAERRYPTPAMKLDAERLLSAPLRVASANERDHVLKVQTGRRRSASERQSHLLRRALSYAHGGVFSPISSSSRRRSGVSLSKRILVISAPRRDTGFRFSRTWPTGSVRTLATTSATNDPTSPFVLPFSIATNVHEEIASDTDRFCSGAGDGLCHLR